MDRLLISDDPTLTQRVREALGAEDLLQHPDPPSALRHLRDAPPALVLVHGNPGTIRSCVSAVRDTRCGPLHTILGLVDRADLGGVADLVEAPGGLDAVGALPLEPAQLRARVEELERANRASPAALASVYARFFSLSADLFTVLDFQGNIRNLNRNWESTTGFPLAELRSHPALHWVHPEDREATGAVLDRLIRERGRASHTMRVQKRDGTYVWLEATGASSPEENLIYIVARDVTELRSAESDLKRSLFLLDTIIENIPDMICLESARDLSILRVNRAYETFLGIGRNALVGRTAGDIFGEPEGSRIADDDRNTLDSGGTERFAPRVVATPANGNRVVQHTRIPILDERGEVAYRLGICQDLTDRRVLDAHLSLLTTALECAANAIVLTDCHGLIKWANRSFSDLTGYSLDEVVGQHTRILKSGRHDDSFYADLWTTVKSGRVWTGEFVNRRKDGSTYLEEATITPVRDESGTTTNFIAIKQDVTERRGLESQLAQASKLQAVGQLAAGIAHEINTPTQYVGDNTRFLQDAFRDLLGVLGKVKGLVSAPELAADRGAAVEDLARALEAADVDYLVEEIPRALEQSLEGIARVSTIVRAMKEFSHPSTELTPTDLNRAIESTATVARNEWKYVADLELDLDPTLPPIACVPGEFNQAILNMLVNAAHAVRDVVGDRGDKGTITISTRLAGDAVEIRIRDTGTGILPEHRSRIFDQFYTTKPVGQGTGQGLSHAHSVIVRKMGGRLDFETVVGEGTVFVIVLPIHAEETREEAGHEVDSLRR